MTHKVCAECGSSLDYGEKCDCDKQPIKRKPPRKVKQINTQCADKQAEKRLNEWLWI